MGATWASSDAPGSFTLCESVATAQQSAQSERKSTTRYGEELICLHPIFLTLFS